MTTSRQRSPNYPTIGLDEAIDLVKRLYQREKRGFFPPEMAHAAWGYKSFSGPVRSKVSALKQYGLLDQNKGQEARLSDRALTVILRNPASKEYSAVLREAALDPPLFKEFYESRSDSSDETLTHELIVNRSFTDAGARQLIAAFRSSMAVAGLTDADIMSGTEREGIDDKVEEHGKMPLPPTPPGTTDRVIPLPLSPTKWVNLQGPFPVTRSEWTLMLKVLEAHKPGLVTEEHVSSGPESEEKLTEDEDDG